MHNAQVIFASLPLNTFISIIKPCLMFRNIGVFMRQQVGVQKKKKCVKNVNNTTKPLTVSPVFYIRKGCMSLSVDDIIIIKLFFSTIIFFVTWLLLLDCSKRLVSTRNIYSMLILSIPIIFFVLLYIFSWLLVFTTRVTT